MAAVLFEFCRRCWPRIVAARPRIVAARPRARRPVRNPSAVGFAEPRGTLLVTEKCRGMEADVGCRLNPVAREIWLYADGRHSIEEIADRVSRRFAVPYAVALEDSCAFIQVMTEHRFLSIRS